MAGHTEITPQPPVAGQQHRRQQRHTVAAIVYFLYGLFYLYGAQYLTSMQATQRGMSHPRVFFILGAMITILFPLLIYSRFALGLSLHRRASAARQTLFINLTLILGLLVCARVAALLRGGLYARSPLHTIALGVAAINAACLLWAACSQPLWVERSATVTGPERVETD